MGQQQQRLLTVYGKVWRGGGGLWCFKPLSAISWRSVLLVEETGLPGEKPRSVASH